MTRLVALILLAFVAMSSCEEDNGDVSGGAVTNKYHCYWKKVCGLYGCKYVKVCVYNGEEQDIGDLSGEAVTNHKRPYCYWKKVCGHYGCKYVKICIVDGDEQDNGDVSGGAVTNHKPPYCYWKYVCGHHGCKYVKICVIDGEEQEVVGEETVDNELCFYTRICQHGRCYTRKWCRPSATPNRKMLGVY